MAEKAASPHRANEKGNLKYLVSSKKDAQWGMTVNTVGALEIEPHYEVYPPKVGHPENFYFDIHRGRILDSYQLVYISQGKGRFFTSRDHAVGIDPGTFFILKPNTWHSYAPDKETGWKEYWIGMKGAKTEQLFDKAFFDEKKNVYHIGFHEELIEIYNRAVDVAVEERAAYQQYLAGIVHLIVGMAIYFSRNKQFENDSVEEQINRARTLMRGQIYSESSAREIACQVNMSYSWFRKKFKEYTNTSPGYYLQDLKLQEAKKMLLSTPKSVKEIAFSLKYRDAAYFATQFKKHYGLSPGQFRRDFRGR